MNEFIRNYHRLKIHLGKFDIVSLLGILIHKVLGLFIKGTRSLGSHLITISFLVLIACFLTETTSIRRFHRLIQVITKRFTFRLRLSLRILLKITLVLPILILSILGIRTLRTFYFLTTRSRHFFPTTLSRHRIYFFTFIFHKLNNLPRKLQHFIKRFSLNCTSQKLILFIRESNVMKCSNLIVKIDSVNESQFIQVLFLG